MSFWGRKKVLVTGGAGFLGRNIVRRLEAVDALVKSPRSKDYDLTSAEKAWSLFDLFAPEIVVHAAATVGGIGFNAEHPGRMIYENLAIGMNVLHMAKLFHCAKVVVIGTTCSYPKFAPIPFRETDLWSGYPEETNAPYGIAKRAVFTMAKAYREEYGLSAISLLPSNLYGPGDNFNPASSHVIPAMIRKIYEAKTRKARDVILWGTGEPSREFLYVDDAAEAVVLAAERYSKPDPMNLGCGIETKIRDLAELVAHMLDYRGQIRWDTTKPDGQPKRCLDTSRAKRELGWTAKTPLDVGLRRTIEAFLKSLGQEP